jgi:hypothetical protein
MSPSSQEDLELLKLLEQPENLPVALQFREWMGAVEPRPDAPKEARLLLANPQNWDTAREIVNLLRQAPFRAYTQFWEHVEAALNSRLKNRDDMADWRVVLSLQRSMTSTYLSIAPKKRHIEQGARVCAEDLARKCFFGVFVGERGAATRSLEVALRHDKYKPGKTYAGYRYFRDLGLSAFGGLSDDLLRINADNHTQARPVAASVADFMWTLFERYAKDIDALNFARTKRPR